MAQHVDDDTVERQKLRGAKIRLLRQQTGVKKAPFAKRCGCSYSHLDNVEHGRKQPSIELLHRIANQLGVDIDEISLAETDLRESA
ncbi:helix-turn-helix domain-containing protein [Actinomadura sp. LOL_016]|uniref:helix-turn-helix domain-containing protein n=1 Tax=unclassified Actinomadura TaxID=2626254 RepID=UPI003A80322C